MIVNVTKLDLRLERGENDRIVLAMTLQNDLMKHPVSTCLWNLEHISRFATYLAGETTGLRRIAFTDLGLTITDVYPRGFTIIHLYYPTPPNTRAAADVYRFVLPGWDLAATIRGMLKRRLEEQLPITTNITPATFARWSKLYAPRVKLTFSDPVFDHESPLDRYRRCVKERPELKKHIQKRIRHAVNYSDGDLVTVTIFNDPIPDSFAFGVHTVLEEKIINGGIIWHEDTSRYQTHTRGM